MALPDPFGEEYINQDPTVLQVNQRYWSYFKNTGRKFSITCPGEASPLFVVQTKHMGKYRSIEDRHGKQLCQLERNFFSKKTAWALTRSNKKLLTVSYNWLAWEMRITMEGSESAKQESSSSETSIDLHIKPLNRWGSCFTVTLGDRTIMRMRCTNMMNNFLSSFKVTPPRLDVDVVEGTDLVLVRFSPDLESMSSQSNDYISGCHTPRFELDLRIIDLNNIPLVSGTAFIKWRLPSSNSNDNHGTTDKTLIIDHRASWNYERTLQLRLTIDRDQALHECEIQFDVVQEFSSGGHIEKNLLGRVKLNLCEYVDKSDDDEGIVRRYLMQDSKINSTLKIGIAVQQLEGDRNFTTPPLKSAMAFGGITGVVASEQAETDDLGQLPLINAQSREVADMQEMYRRTLAASWTSRSDDLPADKLIEGLFSGSAGLGDPRDHPGQPAESYSDERTAGDGATGRGHTTSRDLLSPNFERRARSSTRHSSGNKALDFSPAIDHPGKSGSIEHQLYDSVKGKSWKNRNTEHELSEFDVRRLFLMLSQSSKCARGLLKYQSLPSCRLNTNYASMPPRGVVARHHNTSSKSSDDTPPNRPSYNRQSSNIDRPRENMKGEKIPLDMPFLGKPGEVMLVPDRSRRYFPIPWKQPKTDKSDALPLFLNDVEQEAAGVSDSEVKELLESFRSPYQPRDKLAPNDWEDLRSRLQSSFTYRQLLKYVSRKPTNNQATEIASINGHSNTAEWRPGTSLFFETGDISQESVAGRVAVSHELKGKKMLAERILRDYWFMGITDEIGQLDIRLPRHTFALLLGSTHFSFEDLANLHEVKIDVTQSLGLVRVTGKQRLCESVREIIHDTTNRIREEEINLLPPDDARIKTLSRALSPDFLAWVGEKYGVSFEQNLSQLPTRMFYLLENKPDADNARRTLNLALNKAASPPTPFSTYMSASELSEIRDVDPNDTAPWPDRGKSWFRWEKSTAQDTFTGLAGSFFSKDHLRLSGELLKVLREAGPANASFKSFSEPQESITAAFGKSFFLRKPILEENQVSASQLGKMDFPKTFTKEIPRAVYLLRKLTPYAGREAFRSHRIRLVPSAFHANIFPQLELDLAITPGRTNSLGDRCVIRSAKALMAESNIDYLLPEGAVDIRFTRKLTHEVLAGLQKTGSLATIRADLRDCLNKSDTSTHDVPLPVFAPITLPAHLLRNVDNTAYPNGTATAEYIYSPVHDVQATQVHQYEFRGQQLFYTISESGPLNPHATTDIFLQMDMDSIRPSAIEEEFNSMYNAAHALSFELNMV
ncbi:mitochondrial inner-membrane-bound regulator-domain-containing protein [Aspergillus cavernicola]|uniref:Mitochondrial inner-membrane-bound regulator-domain-containing protein n=1 Tax=Aspergillus cavernicola TaxID=176166 RepID=A0ABR4IGI2_9EURO